MGESRSSLGVPLMAGPSGTTNRALALGKAVGLANQDLYRVAFSFFAFFNGMWGGYSGTHRLHEVMAVAGAHLGFDVSEGKYPSVSEV